MNNLQRAFLVSVALAAGFSGCSRGPVSSANYGKINADGTESLAEAEKIIGAKAVESRGDAVGKKRMHHDVPTAVGVASYILDEALITGKLNGKRKLKFRAAGKIDKGPQPEAVADENGSEVKWFCWEDGDKVICVAVLDDRVFMKLRSGFNYP